MITAQRISKHYRDAGQCIDVLKNVSFEISTDDTVALTGESGAGKSTLLHLLGGFEQADAGEIIVHDQDISVLSDRQASRFRRRHLGVVFQQFNLITSLTALDNITFIRRLNGMPPRDDYTDALIDTLRLRKRLKHFPGQMSGGEQQRVAIARALATKPSLILADEPTGSLDEHTASTVIEQFKQAINLDGGTLLIVTHSNHIAAQFDHCWRLAEGTLHFG